MCPFGYCVEGNSLDLGKINFQGVFGMYQGASNHEEMHNLMKATVMIRRLKKDVLSELPMKRRQQVLELCFLVLHFVHIWICSVFCSVSVLVACINA